jgi:hypothetical protein
MVVNLLSFFVSKSKRHIHGFKKKVKLQVLEDILYIVECSKFLKCPVFHLT